MLMSASPGWFARILCPTAERLFVCAHVHFTVLVRLPQDALRLPVPSPSGSSRRNNVTRSNRPLPPLSSLSLDLKLLERRSKRARDAKKRQAKAHLIGREDQGPALRKLGGAARRTAECLLRPVCRGQILDFICLIWVLKSYGFKRFCVFLDIIAAKIKSKIKSVTIR